MYVCNACFAELLQGSSQEESLSSSQKTSSSVLAKEALIEIDYSSLSDDLKVNFYHHEYMGRSSAPPCLNTFRAPCDFKEADDHYYLRPEFFSDMKLSSLISLFHLKWCSNPRYQNVTAKVGRGIPLGGAETSAYL